MAGPTGSAAEWALNMLFGVSMKYTATFPVYVGLLTTLPSYDPTLASLVEVSATGYSRQVATVGAASEAAPIASLTNTAALMYGPFTGATGSGSSQIVGAFATTASSGTTGDVIWLWALGQPTQCGQNGSLTVPIGGLVATVTSN